VTFDCHVETIVDMRSHGIAIADIRQIRVRPGRKPLLYSDGQFASFSCPSGSCRYVYGQNEEELPSGDPTLQCEL
jgi:flavin reductase (DIM6/NTAB) family NADH-FMN oxidoreductase RutF